MSRRALYASIVALLFLFLFLAPATIHGTTANHLLISEVLYDPAAPEPGAEFVELYNPTAEAFSLAGWALKDNSSSDALPDASIAPGQFLVVASNQADFLAANPGFAGALIALDSPIGNGLSNAGDAVHLVDASGAVVDAMSYGSDTSVFNPSCLDVSEGQSLSRTSVDSDSDATSDWSASSSTPGGPWSPPPEPTATHTHTPAPTLTASWTPSATRTATVTKTSSPTYTWTPTRTSSPTSTPSPTAAKFPTPSASSTETPLATPSATYTPSPTLTASSTGSTTPTFTPSGTLSPTPSTSATAATAPSPTITPTPSRTPTRTPGSWPPLLISEVFYDPPQSGTDSDWEWIEVLNPTNETVLLSGWRIGDNTSQDAMPNFTLVPGARAVVAANEDAFRSNYPGFTGLLISVEGNIGNGLSNTGDAARLIAPDTSVVDAMSYGGDTSVFDPPCAKASPGASLGRWNTIDTDSAFDWTTELQPSPGAGTVVTPTPTRTNTPAEDPNATSTPNRTSTPTRTPTSTRTPRVTHTPTVTRTPTATRTPTPTRTPTSTATHTTTPTTLPPEALKVSLNEILPDPESVDWDRDGQASFVDEWIELFNAADVPVSLDAWLIGDETAAYKIPAGTVIWPRSFLLLYRSQTRLSLSDWRDAVTLMRSDGTLADHFNYDRGPGADRSYCRNGDGAGPWTRDCEVTPGEANRMAPAHSPSSGGLNPPTPTPALQTVADARAAKEDSRVVISGTVTMPPGLIEKTIYLQDKTGGIRVYLRKGEYGSLKPGDRVRATGWTRNFYGEIELSVPDPSYLSVLGGGKEVTPKTITASALVEANEGQFVQVVGSVVRYETRGLVLKDRSGLMRIYFPESLPWRRPYVRIGEMWLVQGVLAQYLTEKTTDTGYRIIPRFKSDVLGAPAVLPTTGGDLTEMCGPLLPAPYGTWLDLGSLLNAQSRLITTQVTSSACSVSPMKPASAPVIAHRTSWALAVALARTTSNSRCSPNSSPSAFSASVTPSVYNTSTSPELKSRRSSWRVISSKAPRIMPRWVSSTSDWVTAR